MNLKDRKENLDVLVKHFQKFPDVLKRIQASPEDMEWIMDCEDMEDAVESVKSDMEDKKPISSVEDLRKKSKEKENGDD